MKGKQVILLVNTSASKEVEVSYSESMALRLLNKTNSAYKLSPKFKLERGVIKTVEKKTTKKEESKD